MKGNKMSMTEQPKLKRYTPIETPDGLFGGVDMSESGFGEYVLFSDVEAYTKAAIAAAMQVKPLEFADETGNGTLTARSAVGLFRIFPQSDGDFYAPSLPLDQASSKNAKVLINRINAAYQARILSTLSIHIDANQTEGTK